MNDLENVIRDLVYANRILAHEGVVDAFGHISVRHPDHPDQYLLSCSRSPELVTREDIMAFTLDGAPVDASDTRSLYAERFIHGGLYAARGDAMSVVHNHAQELIPFGVTGTALKPLMHVAAPIGAEVPIWDIRDQFGDTNMLVVNNDHSADLAACLGNRPVALMRGHGCVVTCDSIPHAVLTSVYLMVNARLQLEAMNIGAINFLSPGEVELCGETLLSPLGTDRAWEYLVSRAGCKNL